MTAFVANTNLLELKGLKAHVGGSYINSAVVRVTIYVGNVDDNVKLGPSSPPLWPMTMEYVSGSNGDYRAVLSKDLPFEPKKLYTAVIEADAGSSPFEQFGHWEFKFKPETRTGLNE